MNRISYFLLLLFFSLPYHVTSDYNQLKYRPFSVIDEIEPYLVQVQSSPPGAIPLEDIAKLWTRAGDAYDAARNITATLNARRKAEKAFSEALVTTPESKEIAGSLMLSRVKLSESLRSYHLFEEARQVLKLARKFAKTSPSAASVSVIAALWRAEASIERCAGRKKQAIAAWNRGAPGGMGGAWPVNVFNSATEIHLALDLWTTLGSSLMDNDEREIEIDALASQEQSSNPSATRYNDELSNRRKRIADFLIASGPWERPTQLPRNYTRGLRALPWHTIDENDTESRWTVVKDLVALAKAASPALLAEWKSLPQSLKLVENECIADLSHGKWSYTTVNAPWIRDIDNDGCSIQTPVACALLHEARSLGMGGSALRGTYSSLAGGTRLRPHCGLTNGQIKLHVGLEIPSLVRTFKGEEEEISESAGTNDLNGTPCAFLTVSGETRAWRAGEVLVFDDSFEHHVTSTCKGERTVFQLVIPHPEIPINKRDLEKGGLNGGD